MSYHAWLKQIPDIFWHIRTLPTRREKTMKNAEITGKGNSSAIASKTVAEYQRRNKSWRGPSLEQKSRSNWRGSWVMAHWIEEKLFKVLLLWDSLRLEPSRVLGQRCSQDCILLQNLLRSYWWDWCYWNSQVGCGSVGVPGAPALLAPAPDRQAEKMGWNQKEIPIPP